jgi:hypothetical protein
VKEHNSGLFFGGFGVFRGIRQISTYGDDPANVSHMRTTILLCAVILSVSGCSSTVPGPAGADATFRWVKGELTSAMPASLPSVEQATRASFEELNLVGVDGAVDGLKGVLTARMAVGTKVRVRLVAIDFDNTTVRIKVGKIGDRSISLQLLRHIERNLE